MSEQEFRQENPAIRYNARGIPMLNVGMPTDEPDPAPFPVDTHFSNWNATQPLDRMADNHDAFAKVLHFVSRPFIAQGYNATAALNRGMAGLFSHLDNAAKFLERNGLGESQGLFEKLADNYDQNANYYRQRADENGLNFLDELFSDAIGQAVPSVAQFMLDIESGLTLSYAAGSQEAYKKGQSPLAGGLLEAARTGLLGGLFRMVQPLNVYLRTPTIGTIGGIQAMEGAPEGKKAEAFVKGFVTMAGFSATSPGGRLGLNDLYENARPLIEQMRRPLGDAVQPVPTLRPAIRVGDQIAIGLDGEPHASIIARVGKEGELGFADADGNFLTREQAKARLKIDDPDAYRTWVKLAGNPNAELHTKDYNKAMDIRTRLKNEGGFTLFPGWDKVENLYQRAVNRFASIENLDARAKALGATILPGQSPKLRARGYLGLGGKVQSILRDKTYRITDAGKIEITGEGLKPILDDYERTSPEKDYETRQQEFNQYFQSVRYIEDLQRPKGEWTDEKIATPEQIAESEAYLENLTRKYGDLDHFEAIAERVYSFQRRILHTLVDSGNLSEAQYQRIIAQNPHYVPFQRIMDEVEPTSGGPRAMKPFTEARSKVKGIRGSQREVEDIIGSIVKNVWQTTDVAERNTVARNVARLAGIEGLRIDKIPVPVHAIHVRPEEIDTITREFRSQSQEVIRETRTTGTTTMPPGETPTSGPMQKLEGIVKEALERRGFQPGEAESALNQIKRAAAKKPEGETAPVGETQTVETTIDRIVKETVKLIEMPTESTIWRPSPFKPRGKIIEYYEKGKKQYIDVPENLYDAMSGMNSTSSDFLTRLLSAPAALLRLGVTRTPEFIVRNYIRDNFDAFIQNTNGFRPGIDATAAIADVIGRNDLYYDWLRSGGAHSTFVDLSSKNIKRVVKELQKDPSAWKYLNIVHDMGAISQAIEESTRLGVYNAALRNGKTPVEAGFAAREATVDFGVHGQSEGLRKFSSITAFFNPAIQGTDRTVRAHIQSPVSTAAKAVAAVTIPSAILWYLNKDDPDYKELPTWQKDLFWVIKVGDSNSSVEFVRIPKPFVIGQVYGSSVERFLSYVHDKDPKAIKGFFMSLIDAATPVQGDPNGVFLPTAVKPLIENSSNWQFFKERPVVPESRKDLLPELQYGKYTSETAKIIGDRLNLSPAKVENLITGWSGGMGQYSLEALDLALKATGAVESKGKRPSEWADYPLVKAFVTRPVVSNPQSLTDFYDNAREVEAAYLSFNDSIKNMDSAKAKKFMREYPRLMLYPTVEGTKEAVAQLDKAIDLISQSKMNDEAKRKAIMSAESIRLKIVQTANRLLEKREEGKTTDEAQSTDKFSGKSDVDIMKQAAGQ